MEGKHGTASSSSTAPPPAKRQRQEASSSLQTTGLTDDELYYTNHTTADEEQGLPSADEQESEEHDGSLLLLEDEEGSASPSGSSLPSPLPPAPPCTPTSTTSTNSQTMDSATPLPRYRFDDNNTTIMSTSFLEQSLSSGGSNLYHDMEEGAITPAPYKASTAAAAAAAAMAETPAGYNTSGGGATTATTETTSSAGHRHQHHSQAQQRPSATAASLPEDFSEWAVGDRYQLLRMLGRGSYGEVAQAKDLYYQPNAAPASSSSSSSPSPRAGLHEFVAIKRIQSPFDQEVDAVRLFREMHILRRLRGHECIIQLIDVVQPPSDDLDDFHDLYLVFEYVDTDLYKLIMSPQYLTTEHIQTFLYQMLTGLKFIHSSSVIHRDLKPANILLNEDCSLKICDFGLARIVPPADTALSSPKPTTASGSDTDAVAAQESNPNAPATPNTTTTNSPSFGSSPPKVGLTRQLTKHVVTRWYRAPELILLQPYTAAVDMWSLGCILAELLSMQEGSVPGYQDRSPLFPGGACYPLSSGEGYMNTSHPQSKGDGNNTATSASAGSASNKEVNNNKERLDQLSVIFGVIGPPSPEDIASMGKANEYLLQTLSKRTITQQNRIQQPLLVQQQPVTPLEQLYPAADPLAMDLLKKMLQFNPQRRCTAEEALKHAFFQNVRKPELEVAAEQALVGPDFLETNQSIDLATLKRRTYEEVLWWRDPNPSSSPSGGSKSKSAPTKSDTGGQSSGEPPTSSNQHQPP